MALSAIAKAVIRVVLTVASVAYQQMQQKKMKREMDKRKGFEFTVSGESAALPVVYGKQVIGGVATSRKVTTGFEETSSTEDTLFAEGLDTGAVTGTKSEFLHVQYALCQGGIEGVQGMLVNGLAYDDADAGFKHRIRIYNDTIPSSPATHEAMGFPATNLFTGAASSTATYRLNRDDYNYNGEPQVQFLMKGRKVRAVELNVGVYSLASTYVYSNNPALVLIDYLTNAEFGRSLPVTKLDLESFYNAAAVCATVVSSGRSIGGIINGGAGTRDIPLYECNITLDTEASIRENVERILETMGFAEMMWSPEGKYKIALDYPTSTAETDALIPSTHVFTDDNILRDEVSLSWLSASERSNQATVNFMNEHEDFKEDSMTWPVFGSTAYNTYLTEDNQQPLKKNLQVAGITDPYHALARAEQEVRKSRELFTIEFTADKQALSVEIGDLIKLTLSTSGLTDEVFKVNAMEVRADMSVKISAYSFSHEMLAWNVNDDIAYSTRPTYDFTVDDPTSVTYTAQTSELDVNSIGYLSWVNPVEGASTAVVTYTTADTTTPVKLAETSGTSLPIYSRTDWTDGETVTFKVRIKSPLGKMSTGVTAVAAVDYKPAAPTAGVVVESLYQTNTAAGVKARVDLSWSHAGTGVTPVHYRVEYYRDEDGSTYAHLDNVTDTDYIFNDVRAGNYHFRVTAISGVLYNSIPLVFASEVEGLTAVPSDPAGFIGTVQSTGIILSWTKPTDLDVLFGGHTQIRFARDTGTAPNWPDAQVLVNQVDGNATSKSVPLTQGYFLIKHFDSTGNESATAQTFLNNFTGNSFNQIADVNEAPTFGGTKTNCTVVGSELHMDSGSTSMTYQFTDTIDLGEAVEVTLSPDFVARSYDLTLVSSYMLISDVANFAGVDNSGSVNFEVRTTDDDPTGTPTWSAWEPLIAGFYNNRAFQIRMTASTTDTGFAVEFTSVGVTLDKADVAKSGQSTSSAVADTTVTYTAPFYGGIDGLATPRLGVNIIGGSVGDNVVIATRTKSDFTYSVYDSGGSRVAKDVDWLAIGQ